jgi:sugar phosphate isomerase/epimerase
MGWRWRRFPLPWQSPSPIPKSPGVQIGVQSYSFRDRPLDDAIKGMVEVGLSECELWQGHIEPQGVPREELRNGGPPVSLDTFKSVKQKFDDAGIQLYAYNYSFKPDFDDVEMARGFEMAKGAGRNADYRFLDRSDRQAHR